MQYLFHFQRLSISLPRHLHGICEKRKIVGYTEPFKNQKNMQHI